MIFHLIFVLLGLSNVVHAFSVSNSSGLRVENGTSKKVKRWAPGFQDIAADYPDFDDPFLDNQIEVARPFSTSPGDVLLYRQGSRRPSGAVTRTIFNPPSGFIPRVFAAAKAAFTTLTGPQTVLSRTTYLPPPRPGIAALQVPQGPPVVGPQGGTNAAAAAAAAAAAVAAVTRSIYEAASHRGNGFYEKEAYLPPSTYNSYGVWPESSRLPWTTLQPPDLTVRIPHESWDRPRPNIMDTYGPPSPTWFNQNPVISIEAPRNPWMDNKDTYNSWNQWNNYNRNQENWVQENRIKNWIDERRMKTAFGRAGGNGGYAAANADTPPNGDSYVDAKITANGASAVAAAVWNLGRQTGKVNESKRTKTEVYSAVDDDDEERAGTPRKEQYETNKFRGRIDSDLEDKMPGERQCSDNQGCLAKRNAERLRLLFPSRRRP